MRRRTLPASLATWALLTHAAFAQAVDNTLSNGGTENPLSPAASTGLAAFGIVFTVVWLALGIFLFVTWIRMIIHAAKNPIENKGMWLVIVIVFGAVGAIIYYFAVKRPFDSKMHGSMPMQT